MFPTVNETEFKERNYIMSTRQYQGWKFMSRNWLSLMVQHGAEKALFGAFVFAAVVIGTAGMATGAVQLNDDSTAVVGDVSQHELSPDGATVVYLAEQDQKGRAELYSVAIGGGTPVKLNDTPVAGGYVHEFTISADSTRVVYRADQDTDGVYELYSVPIGGGYCGQAQQHAANRWGRYVRL